MRVLIIDDSTTMHRIQSFQLNSMGITDILTAINGEEGLRLLRENLPIDIVVLDINMPKMSGLAVLEQIRGDRTLKDIRVVMVTSEAGKLTVLEAIKAGANDYIIKPFTKEEFRARIFVNGPEVMPHQ